MIFHDTIYDWCMFDFWWRYIHVCLILVRWESLHIFWLSLVIVLQRSFIKFLESESFKSFILNIITQWKSDTCKILYIYYIYPRTIVLNNNNLYWLSKYLMEQFNPYPAGTGSDKPLPPVHPCSLTRLL